VSFDARPNPLDAPSPWQFSIDLTLNSKRCSLQGFLARDVRRLPKRYSNVAGWSVFKIGYRDIRG